ncbi:MAG: WG repeat-containing protein [Flavobacteriales bacterium]|nr:WG repeat-containing protein [Flavobacteriales bacterium]
MKARRFVLFIVLGANGFLTNAQHYSFDFDQPALAPDTFYFPFYNGLQLIVIDHASRYEMWMMGHSHMGQIPSFRGKSMNEYCVRDSSGQIIKTYNSNVKPNEATLLLREVSYTDTGIAFESYRESIAQNYNFGLVTDSFSALPSNFYSDDSTIRFGLIDTFGQLTVPIIYNQLIHLDNGLYLAYNHNKLGIISNTNDTFVSIEHERYQQSGRKDNLIYFIDGGRYTLEVNILTKQTVDLSHLEVGMFDPDNGIVLYNVDGKQGLMDVFSGKVLIPCKYSRVVTWHYYSDFRYLEYGIAVVTLNGKYGLVQVGGKTILPCEYDDIERGNRSPDDMIRAYKNGKKVEIPFELVPMKR